MATHFQNRLPFTPALAPAMAPAELGEISFPLDPSRSGLIRNGAAKHSLLRDLKSGAVVLTYHPEPKALADGWTLVQYDNEVYPTTVRRSPAGDLFAKSGSLHELIATTSACRALKAKFGVLCPASILVTACEEISSDDYWTVARFNRNAPAGVRISAAVPQSWFVEGKAAAGHPGLLALIHRHETAMHRYLSSSGFAVDTRKLEAGEILNIGLRPGTVQRFLSGQNPGFSEIAAIDPVLGYR